MNNYKKNGWPKDSIVRFLDKIIPEPNSGCWLWIGCVSKTGYGDFRGTRAHRFAYQHFIGSIPSGLQLDHLCRTRSCVNPKHLEAVTCRENIRRGINQVAQNIQKTHCPNGHPYIGSNLYIRKNKRYCKACHKINNRESYRRKYAQKN